MALSKLPTKTVKPNRLAMTILSTFKYVFYMCLDTLLCFVKLPFLIPLLVIRLFGILLNAWVLVVILFRSLLLQIFVAFLYSYIAWVVVVTILNSIPAIASSAILDFAPESQIARIIRTHRNSVRGERTPALCDGGAEETWLASVQQSITQATQLPLTPKGRTVVWAEQGERENERDERERGTLLELHQKVGATASHRNGNGDSDNVGRKGGHASDSDSYTDS